MIRRSTRLPKQPPKTLAEDAFEPDDDELDVVDEEEDQPSKKARGKKRKANEKADSQQPTKKVRGTRGILKQLVEMPLDVLFEIFGRLDPIDLLHLARTTKDLRALLMNRSSTSIWKESRSNIDGLPECPQDLSEPQYANLAFGKSCYFCLRNLSTIHIIWSARLKTCTKCLDQRFNKKGHDPSRWILYRGYPSELAVLIPSIRIHRKELYLVEVDDRWGAEYKSEKNKKKWLKDKIDERVTINTHANACTIWYEEKEFLREERKASVIDDRKALVVERLNKLGWEEELSKMSNYGTQPQDHAIVMKACQKELTERALSNLEPFLNEYMQAVKRVRLANERRELLQGCLPILDGLLQTYIGTLPANALYPTTSELFRDPLVQRLIDQASTVDSRRDHFSAITPMFPDLTRRWQKDIENKMLDLIRSSVPEYSFDPETVLQLATTTFSCSSCYRGCEAMWHPRVLIHSCATKARDMYNGYYSLKSEDDPDLQNMANILHQLYWNTRSCISFKPENFRLMTEVIQMCGFDPKTTTADEMDAANPIIECLACNSPHLGRETMTWRRVCAHNREEHSSRTFPKEIKLEVMNEQEANIVRARVAEKQERTRASTSYKGMICVHCKQTGNTVELGRHVKKDHGKLNPTTEDIQPCLDTTQIPDAFPLWPPREEVEEEQPQDPAHTVDVTN